MRTRYNLIPADSLRIEQLLPLQAAGTPDRIAVLGDNGKVACLPGATSGIG